jgi:hypothetical protein
MKKIVTLHNNFLRKSQILLQKFNLIFTVQILIKFKNK